MRSRFTCLGEGLWAILVFIALLEGSIRLLGLVGLLGWVSNSQRLSMSYPFTLIRDLTLTVRSAPLFTCPAPSLDCSFARIISNVFFASQHFAKSPIYSCWSEYT